MNEDNFDCSPSLEHILDIIHYDTEVALNHDVYERIPWGVWRDHEDHGGEA